MQPSIARGLFVALFALLSTFSAIAQPKQVLHSDRVDRSPALSSMPRALPSAARAPFAVPNKFYRPGDRPRVPDALNFSDPVQQTAQGAAASAPSVGVNIEGATEDDNASVVGYRVVPPDVQGDVGPNHYFQFINSVFQIFNKSGASVLGPAPGNQIWAGFGGRCESDNDGDPVVLYDHLADRWLVTQFAVSTTPYYMCLAVSTTGNPTGTYNRYAFSFGNNFPDYPKFGVWPDAYYMTTRNFAGGGSFAGVQAVAFERAKMLAGQSASGVIFNIPGGTDNDGWLPADLDGPAPPAGTPGIFAGAPETVGSNQIVLYGMSVNWSSPSSSTLTLLGTLPVSPFDISVYSVLQPKGGEQLDVLPWFLMHRMQYRNFGTYQTLLLNHTVDVGNNRAGIRWYELRKTASSWSVHQQGTYAPDDGQSRWMGSIAMNGNGDIGLAYSISSRNLFPSLRFTGQQAGGSGGVMDIPETVIYAGSGVQKANSYNRWGDYSALTVDPSDDNTFWYTGEYYANSAVFDFKTRIASFSLGTSEPPPPPGDPTYIEVASLSTGTQGIGGGDKLGTASVLIADDLGNPISGASVSGQFSGSVSGTSTQTTNGSGVASFTSATSARGKVTVNFCVSNVSYAGPLSFVPNGTDCGTSKGAVSEGPQSMSLAQNYPNPFNPSTIISFSLPVNTKVTLSVFNMLGQRVETLVNGQLEAGEHRVSFDASALTPGVYVYTLQTPDAAVTKRMTLLK